MSEQLAQEHFMQGSLHASNGEWALAEAEMARAVLLAPALHIARYQLGLLQFSSGRPEVALITWQPLLDAQAEPWMADFVRGFQALERDDFDEARREFGQGLATTEVNPFVAGDIRKVMGAMLPLSGAAEAASHVLIANYGKFGPH